ncbi:MAG TPA: hypothetical protein VHR42_08075 [Clostridia bacterium]|nr:hypothetical protein [Clostridia bacterium]
MTWKISSPGRFSEFRNTYLWVLKKNIGMTVLLAVLMFLCMPLPTIVAISGMKKIDSLTEAQWLADRAMHCRTMIMMEIEWAGVTLLLLFSIVFCVRLFGYMQNRRSVDLFHSFPVGRISMLLGRWCAGMTALVLPTLVNFLILRIVLLSFGISPIAGSMGLVSAMFWVLLMAAAAFTFCMFLTVCSGSMMDTILSLLGINAGFPIGFLLCVQLVQLTLPGMGIYWRDGDNVVPATLLAPFPAAYQPLLVGSALPAWFLPWWIFATAALLVGTCILYRQRRSETAEDPTAFPIPKTIVRFLLTACAGIGIGLGLALVNAGMASFLIGVLAGSIVAHVIVEALYARGFSTLKKSTAWYAVFAVCFLAFYGVLATGCFGYDTRVPDASEVESVSVYIDSRQRQYISSNSGAIRLEPLLKQPESIRTILQIHKDLSGWYRSSHYPYAPGQQSGGGLTLNYRLKNGGTLTRSYIPGSRDWKLIEKQSNAVAKLPEYEGESDLAFYLQPADMKSFTISTDNHQGDTVTISGTSEKAELLKALREYCKNTTFDETENSLKNSNSLQVDWVTNISPDAHLREALGGYSGKILIESSEYLYHDGDVLDQAIQKIRTDFKSSK